jgi:hypothetical protein
LIELKYSAKKVRSSLEAQYEDRSGSIRLVEKYVNGYWRSLDSEYQCGAALGIEVVTVIVALREAKLEIWIAAQGAWIIPIVLIVQKVLRVLIERKPDLLNIAKIIRFDDLRAPIEAVTRIEAEYQVRVILHTNGSRIRTWT